MKAQAQIMSAVLLTGIIIGLIGVAYIWGGPMIQKQKDVVKLKNMETFMKNLNKQIKDVAKHGGTDKITATLPGYFEVKDNGINDIIIMKFETVGSVIEPGREIVLVGEDKKMEKPIGNEPGVIVEKAKKINSKYHITLKLFYRNLTGQEYKYKIDLVPTQRRKIGGIKSGATERTIVLTSLEGYEKGELHINPVKIRM